MPACWPNTVWVPCLGREGFAPLLSHGRPMRVGSAERGFVVVVMQRWRNHAKYFSALPNPRSRAGPMREKRPGRQRGAQLQHVSRKSLPSARQTPDSGAQSPPPPTRVGISTCLNTLRVRPERASANPAPHMMWATSGPQMWGHLAQMIWGAPRCPSRRGHRAGKKDNTSTQAPRSHAATTPRATPPGICPHL